MEVWVLLTSASSSLEGCLQVNLQAYCVPTNGVWAQSHMLLLGEIGSKGDV